MDPIETKIVIDKFTMKKLRSVVVTPFVKKTYIFMFVLFACLLVIGIISSNSSLIKSILLMFPILLSSRFVGHAYGKTDILRIGIRKKRRQNNIKNKEFEFISILNNEYFEIKDAVEYKDNSILKIKYSSFGWLIESEDYYVLIQKTLPSLYGWFTYCGVIDKATIDRLGKREEFIDFIKRKCPKAKLVLREVEAYESI
jgi:hypothetical protein